MEKEIIKPRILFINSVCGFGSTGRIVSDLSKIEEYDTLVCYGRKKDYANVNSYKFANIFDNAIGAIRTILFDNNLNICSSATKKLIKKIKEFNPDIIHLHNLHGYYVNFEMLFRFLKEYNKPVIWTLHDCWAMTGYCPHFDFIKCDKYEIECIKCSHGFSYPFSLFKQKVNQEYLIKKDVLSNMKNLNIVVPSKWLEGVVKKSYLKNMNVTVINNGIDLSNFYPSKDKSSNFTVLAVSSFWTKEKGVDEMNKVIPLLDDDIEVVAIGRNSKQIKGCKTIDGTNNINDLVNLYSSSHVLINTTKQDTFPTVNIESIACGTPVITYKTGGSPELIDSKTGIIIEKGNYILMAKTINTLKRNYHFKVDDCVKQANKFTKEKMIANYIDMYKKIHKV